MKVQGGDVMKRGVGLLMKRLEGLTGGGRRRKAFTGKDRYRTYFPEPPVQLLSGGEQV